MERLTEKRNGTNVIPLRNAICGTDMPYWKITTAGDLTEYLSGNAADRLAAYDDICFNADGTERISIDRLRELAEADKDGRITITPAKKELTEKEASEITGYKCPICKHHEYCTLPMVTPLCGPVYDHFEEIEAAEAVLKAGDRT